MLGANVSVRVATGREGANALVLPMNAERMAIALKRPFILLIVCVYASALQWLIVSASFECERGRMYSQFPIDVSQSQ